MDTKLFEQIIFGPVKSRRLGVSLGVNLLPAHGKICTFDCIYCECGYNKERRDDNRMPSRDEVKNALESRLIQMLNENQRPDVITFAGNGEPTLHPDFEMIIEDTLALRNNYFSEAKICVLSNSTRIERDSVFRALNRVDRNIMKLDSVFPQTFRMLNVPNQSGITVSGLIENLKRFNGNLIIQTMFLRGEHEGQKIDNTTTAEIDGWLGALVDIRPRSVMIYTIDRPTPESNLEKLTQKELETIADKARELGFDVSVSA